jgi:hypothetical protein
MKKKLGQFMTPPQIANLVAYEIGGCSAVIDFAAGEGALLAAIQNRSRKVLKLYGVELDESKRLVAATNLKHAKLWGGSGLTGRYAIPKSRSTAIVGNPPYLDSTSEGLIWLERAFQTFKGRLGADRAEIQFLARALVTAKTCNGRVVFVMPVGFADGDLYKEIRASLMREYSVKRCIEVAASTFRNTEARTVILVVEPKGVRPCPVEICEYDAVEDVCKTVAKTILDPGSRLDARYHKALGNWTKSGPLLKDLMVDVSRGGLSRNTAALLNIPAIHTSDINRLIGSDISIELDSTNNSSNGMLTAKEGDILLPRTGTRVRWEPILVRSGEAVITDHVFRIRAPKAVRKVVYHSFNHPAFKPWLEGICKGVCATVLTKRELLEMPVFAA